MSGDVPISSVSPDLWNSFQLVEPEGVDKILWHVRPSACLLVPCPTWLIKSAQEGLAEWTEREKFILEGGSAANGIKAGSGSPPPKRKPALDPTVLDNYQPVLNPPFLGKVVERVVASPVQRALDEAAYLDPFQFGFRTGFGTEAALVALVDDLR